MNQNYKVQFANPVKELEERDIIRDIIKCDKYSSKATLTCGER